MAVQLIDQLDPNNAAPNSTNGSLDPTTSQLAAFNYAYNDNLEASDFPGAVGTKSLFNNYAVYLLACAGGDYNNLYDSSGAGVITSPQSRNPSAAAIINWANEGTGDWNPAGSTPYSFSDFMYCKYYGMIPNNYLVTLRRFPIPTLDNLKTADGKAIPPIAQALTWMGDETDNKLSEFFKFSFGQNWEEIEAYVQSVEGNEKDLTSVFTGKAGAAAGTLQGILNPTEYSGLANARTEYAKKLYEQGGPLANRVYGPVNVIDKTMVRRRGMHFDNEIKLNFHYSLKSIGGINPKAAMLDLMSNFLTLTYNNAKFWGGAIRYFPQHPQHPFIGGKVGQNAFYSGNIDTYINSISDSLGTAAGGLGDMLSKMLQDPLGAIKELFTAGAIFQHGKIAARSRPQIIAMQSLLTGAPVGEWHLVVGNPMNPVALIGNLVCTNVEFEFGNTLGADDFPTELKWTVTLKHGRPRDKGDLESMFNWGNGRLYYGIEDDTVFSSARNSVVDTSGKRGQNVPDSGAVNQGDNNTYTALAQSAKRSLSMWGTKFNQTQLKIASVWVGDQPPAGSTPTPPPAGNTTTGNNI